MNPREIEERPRLEESRDEWPRDLNHARTILGLAHADRAFLLAEVKRLQGDLSVANLRLQARMCSECPQEAEVRRLKALCGRAAEQITLGWADCGTDDGCECEDCSAVRKANNLAAELKEASE